MDSDEPVVVARGFSCSWLCGRDKAGYDWGWGGCKKKRKDKPCIMLCRSLSAPSTTMQIDRLFTYEIELMMKLWLSDFTCISQKRWCHRWPWSWLSAYKIPCSFLNSVVEIGNGLCHLNSLPSPCKLSFQVVGKRSLLVLCIWVSGMVLLVCVLRFILERGQEQRDRGQKIASRLSTDSTEPHLGLELPTREIFTWTKVRRSADRATQVAQPVCSD